MKIINLTPHTITIIDDNGNVVGSYESAGLARVDSLPLGDVVGLPEPEDGTVYVVSVLVAERLPHRADLRVPGGQVRDGDGRIIGCRSLAEPSCTSPALALLTTPVVVVFGSAADPDTAANARDLDIIYANCNHRAACDVTRSYYDSRHQIDAHPELASIDGGLVVVEIPYPAGLPEPEYIVLSGAPEIRYKPVRSIAASLRKLAADRDVEAFAATFPGGAISLFAHPDAMGSEAYAGNGIQALKNAINHVFSLDFAAIGELIPGLPRLLQAIVAGPHHDCLPTLRRGTAAGAGRDVEVVISRYKQNGPWMCGPRHCVGERGALPLDLAAEWLESGEWPLWRLQGVDGFTLDEDLAALRFESAAQAWRAAERSIAGPMAEGPHGVAAVVSVTRCGTLAGA